MAQDQNGHQDPAPAPQRPRVYYCPGPGAEAARTFKAGATRPTFN